MSSHATMLPKIQTKSIFHGASFTNVWTFFLEFFFGLDSLLYSRPNEISPDFNCLEVCGFNLEKWRVDNWDGANIHIFVSTDLKNIRI